MRGHTRRFPDDTAGSEDHDSKWGRFFEDEEIQKVTHHGTDELNLSAQEIMNDVTRTYPDLDFFRKDSTQTLLMRVLFIWVKLHPELGYRYHTMRCHTADCSC